MKKSVKGVNLLISLTFLRFYYLLNYVFNPFGAYIREQRAQLGIQAFADALLVVPKTLAENSGLDTQDVIISLTVILIYPSLSLTFLFSFNTVGSLFNLNI